MKLNRNDSCHCGSGKKYKKCCLPNDEQQSKEIKSVSKLKQTLPKKNILKQDAIMATLTGEYVQPVRLCYDLYDKQAIHSKVFNDLKCMSYDSSNNRWVWLFDDEAKNLTFEKRYQDIPKNIRPIVLGSFFTDNDNEMYIDVKSHDRALHAIEFFDGYIPRDVAQITEAIVLNRLLTQKEMELLDDFNNFFKDVPIVDKAKEFEDMMTNANSRNEKLNFLESLFEKDKNEIIPDVERVRIHYYEDGIDTFRFSLRIKRIVAMIKFEGKEVTQNDILKIISGTYE